MTTGTAAVSVIPLFCREIAGRIDWHPTQDAHSSFNFHPTPIRSRSRPWHGRRRSLAPCLGRGDGSGPQVLTGTEFDLTIGELPVNFTGRPDAPRRSTARCPAPLLRWREGDTVTLRVTNRLAEPTSIHWHGIARCRPTWTACRA